MEVQELYDLIESHLDNGIRSPQEKMGRLKRMKLPIPKEYGGGVATGWGYEDTVRNLIERVTPFITGSEKIKMEPKTPLFSDCWEAWIAIKAGQDRSPATIENYRFVAKKHLLPFFGQKHLDEITPDDIQTYFNGLMSYSKSFSIQSKTILSGIFDRAVRMGELNRNIMLYQYERSHKVGEKTVLQDADLIRAIEKADLLKTPGYGRDYLYFCFLCFTALRRGEILGLRWSDISFERQEIVVRSNVTFPNGQNEPVLCSPKDGSNGVVLLQTELLQRIKPYARKSGYVVPYSVDEPDRPMTRSMFTKMWNRIDRVIGLKGITSHSFRASYATMMNAHCDHIDPKALQGALRHKTPDLAIKVYTKENVNKTRLAELEYGRWLSEQLASTSLRSDLSGQ